MKRTKVADTDVLIDYLRGTQAAVDFFMVHADDILISSISVTELYAGIRPHEHTQIEAFLSLFHIVPIDGELARLAGLLKRDYFPSHGMSIADAVIAATAQQHSAELLTHNIKHYPMLPDLSPPYLRS